MLNRLNYESYNFVLEFGCFLFFLLVLLFFLLYTFICRKKKEKKKKKEHEELLRIPLIYYVTQNPRHWLAELVLGT